MSTQESQDLVNVASLFLLSGRARSSDFDTQHIVEAPCQETAKERFKDQLLAEAFVDDETGVFIVSCIPLSQSIAKRLKSGEQPSIQY